MSIDPARLAERIRRDAGHWRNTTIAEEAWRAREERPERVALYLEHEPDATYAAIAEEALRLIAALRDLGLEQDDVIAFQLKPRGAQVICPTPSGVSLPEEREYQSRLSTPAFRSPSCSRSAATPAPPCKCVFS